MLVVSMVIVLIVSVVVMLVVSMVIVPMVMSVKCTPFSEIKLHQAMTVHQRHSLCVLRNTFDGIFKKRLKVVAHPEHNICCLQLFCL